MAGEPFKVKPFRRVLQAAVLLVLIAVPLYTANPMEWSPSRIVMGQIPNPVALDVAGDTWHFRAWGLRLVNPIAFFESALAFKALYVPMLWAVAVPLLITLLLGRVFCSWMCPVGFFLELNQKVNAALKKAGIGWNFHIPDFRYTLVAAMLVLAFVFAVPLISVLDPPHVLGRELMYGFTHGTVSLSGTGLLLGILLFEMVAVSRAWCRSVCPSGGGLSVLGKKRLLNIRMNIEACVHCRQCDDVCPYVLAPMGLAKGERFDWTTCDNCGLCRDTCPEGAISYAFKKEKER